MRKFLVLVGVALACGILAKAQSRGGNWPMYGGDTQRSGWEGTEPKITKETAKDIQLLWKMQLDVQPRTFRPVMPPVILGRLISYRGFKELAFVASNADIVYAIDADLGKMFWQKHLEYSANEPQATGSSWACPGGLTAMPTMPPPATAARGGGGAAPARGGGPANAFAGGLPSVYALSSDGRLHRLNTSTGDDIAQPVSVLPPNARASHLNMADNVIYTVTGQGCNGAANAVWAIDLNGSAPKANSFDLIGGSVWGLAGPTIGSDGTVYVQTGEGPFEPSSHKWSNSTLALNPRDLKLKQYFTSASAGTGTRKDTDMNVTSPVVFSYQNRDLIVTAGKDGRLYLLDSASLGGDDHRTPMYRTPQIAADEGTSADHGIWGGLTTWADTGGTRWILAPVWGALHRDFKVPGMNGSTPNGSIVAFKVEEQDGKAMLTPTWVSRDMSSPEPPVVAGGVVFGLSAGEFSRQVKEAGGAISIEERPKGSAHATLYALDAATGKELYSSRNQVSAPAALTGLTVSNWRVYFGGADGAIYAFGLNMEH
jgi:hypothetical protein